MTAPNLTDDDFFDASQWLSLHEFADLVGLKPRTIYNKINTGEDLPERFVLSDRSIRFFKPSVRLWMLKRRRVPAAVLIAQQEQASA